MRQSREHQFDGIMTEIIFNGEYISLPTIDFVSVGDIRMNTLRAWLAIGEYNGFVHFAVTNQDRCSSTYLNGEKIIETEITFDWPFISFWGRK